MKDKQKEAKNKIRGSSPAGLWFRTPVLACRAQVYLLLRSTIYRVRVGFSYQLNS